MPIASAVVEIQDGTSETVLGKLARIPEISVFGIKESQIVTVIEGRSPRDVDAVVKQIMTLDEVLGVYPVFAGSHD